MSLIRSKNTLPELQLRRILRARHLRFQVHASRLPGKPDIVFRREKIAVFVDGDYWHGWRFPCWSHKLTPYWREKIGGNRKRDLINRRALRRLGWIVIRVWEHNIRRDPESCANVVQNAIYKRYLSTEQDTKQRLA